MDRGAPSEPLPMRGAALLAVSLLEPADSTGRRNPLITEALIDAGMTGSIETVGDALDNAVMESTIGLCKAEVIDHERRAWASWQGVEQATASWVHCYNTSRLHSSIDYLPPIEYEQRYREETTGLHDSVAA